MGGTLYLDIEPGAIFYVWMLLQRNFIELDSKLTHSTRTDEIMSASSYDNDADEQPTVQQVQEHNQLVPVSGEDDLNTEAQVPQFISFNDYVGAQSAYHLSAFFPTTLRFNNTVFQFIGVRGDSKFTSWIPLTLTQLLIQPACYAEFLTKSARSTLAAAVRSIQPPPNIERAYTNLTPLEQYLAHLSVLLMTADALRSDVHQVRNIYVDDEDKIVDLLSVSQTARLDVFEISYKASDLSYGTTTITMDVHALRVIPIKRIVSQRYHFI